MNKTNQIPWTPLHVVPSLLRRLCSSRCLVLHRTASTRPIMTLLMASRTTWSSSRRIFFPVREDPSCSRVYHRICIARSISAYPQWIQCHGLRPRGRSTLCLYVVYFLSEERSNIDIRTDYYTSCPCFQKLPSHEVFPRDDSRRLFHNVGLVLIQGSSM